MISGLKGMGGLPGVAFSGMRATPDELDVYNQYIVMKPSVSASALGTANGTASKAITISQTQCDYPRNILVSFTCAEGGGTAVVSGTTQFGDAITESIVVTSAANGGTTGSNNVFAHVASGTWYPTVTTAGTVTLGYAIGTANSCKFGLPSKIGAASDVKMVTFVDNAVVAPVGTPSLNADTTYHAYKPAQAINAQDDYVILFRSTYDSSSEGYQAGL